MERIDDEIKFITSDGKIFFLARQQVCCESVHIHEIVGDLKDLEGEPIIEAAEETSGSQPKMAAWPDGAKCSLRFPAGGLIGALARDGGINGIFHEEAGHY